MDYVAAKPTVELTDASVGRGTLTVGVNGAYKRRLG